MIVRSWDGLKVIGTIENGIFLKKVKGSVHMLRVPRAWGIDCDVYRRDIRPNCHTIAIEDIEEGKTYWVSTKVFDEKMQAINRGFGVQYVLILKYWQVKQVGQKVML